MARRRDGSDRASKDLPGAEKVEEVSHADEGLEDPPAAADAAAGLDEVVEGVALKDSEPVHPRRGRDLWEGVGACLEEEGREERLPPRRRRPSKRA